jgi:hypothetical protein
MTELWYDNPYVLLDNYKEMFPTKNLDRTQKINALVRLCIYYTCIIIFFNKSHNWLYISLIVFLISIYLSKYETINTNLSQINCHIPTKNNPYMNYTIGDLIDNPHRNKACKLENMDNMDRELYTMPNTRVINDQTAFAKWCFGNSGECKTLGTNCLKQRDPTYHRGRLTTLDEEII